MSFAIGLLRHLGLLFAVTLGLTEGVSRLSDVNSPVACSRMIAIHLRHDATISLWIGGRIVNLELERYFRIRHFDWRQHRFDWRVLLEIISPYGGEFEIGAMVGGGDPGVAKILGALAVKKIYRVDHHLAHAACAFYQSSFNRALVISYDGGGNDGTFRAFLASREKGIKPVHKGWQLNLGIPYRALAVPIADIRKPDDNRELSNAGKLMGLVAYGRPRPEWIDALELYFKDCSVPSSMSGFQSCVSHLPGLGRRISLPLHRNTLTGQDAADLAATAQLVLERLLLKHVLPLIREQELPVCITGGCALNVILNQKLAEMLHLPVFVPPNPNDCGLAMGALLYLAQPRHSCAAPLSGFPILDADRLPEFVGRRQAIPVSERMVARLLSEGKIVGILKGRSEHGPRALGNRSILSDPRVPGVRQRLNERIKFRERFRPYAPIIRKKLIDRYCENAKGDLSFMSFNPTIRPEWRQQLQGAMHIDGTARVQSVDDETNPWLHRVLLEFEALTGLGALLNTSFNRKGLPILTRVQDSLEVLDETDLDCVLVEDWLFQKNVRSAQTC